MDHIIDDRTPSKNLPMPHPDNDLEHDVPRLRQALYEIDALIHQFGEVVLSLINDASQSGDRTWSAQRIAQQLTTRQAAHANLTALAGLAGQADRLAYFTADGMALANFEPVARILLAATTKLDQRTALGLGNAAVLGTMSGPAETSTNVLVPRGLAWALHDKQTTLAATGTVELDLATASLFDLTLTGTASLGLVNVPVLPAGEVHTVVLRVRQGSTTYALTWWAGITWLAAATPSAPNANRIAEYVFSYDGATWIGRKGASN